MPEDRRPTPGRSRGQVFRDAILGAGGLLGLTHIVIQAVVPNDFPQKEAIANLAPYIAGVVGGGISFAWSGVDYWRARNAREEQYIRAHAALMSTIADPNVSSADRQKARELLSELMLKHAEEQGAGN